MSTFRFETSDVPVPLTEWVERQLASKVGGCIFGLTGTGKSHAVRKAIPAGSIYVDVKSSDSLLSQRFVADIARQLGAVGEEGKLVLQAFRSEGLEASLRAAERAVNGHPFVVDGVDGLRPLTPNLDEPSTMLWQQEKELLLDWLRSRLEHSPTFLVGRRRIKDIDAGLLHKHRSPSSWPIRLTGTPDGYRNWPLLAKLADNNPAILTLARALVPLLPATAFHSLIEQASDDENPGLVLLERLGQAFQSSAPPAWHKLLSIIDALGDIPLDIIEPLLDGGADIPNSRTPYGFLMRTILLVTQAEDQKSALDLLRQQNLVEFHAGRLSILPALATARAIRPLTHLERMQILPAIAHRLLASINDPLSLVPAQADRVLRAHAIFVELGDLDQAERTASLHVHGLVELARRTSRNEQYADAYAQYDRVFHIASKGSPKSSPTGRKLLSYVRHYRTWNGSLSGGVDNATCLEEYRQSLADWPDNALWHQRVIETLIRLGRPIEATQAMREAYERVSDHPRRDDFLRARPALTALREDLPLLSLEFIEPILDAPVDLCPEVVRNCEKVLKYWEAGIEFDELPFQLAPGVEGLVVFHIREKIELRKRSEGLWSARLCRPFPTIESEANRPRAAIEALVSYVATEARRLISAWTSDLSDKDIRLKGRLISVVDALNSDIGLHRTAERWIVGRIVGKQLIPTMRDLPAVQIPESLLPESNEGLYFAYIPNCRDGTPSGPATKLEPAGSGRGTQELVALLRRMSEDAA